MKKTTLVLSCAMMLFFIAGGLWAREDGRRADNTDLQLSKTTGTPRSTRLNINNISHWFRADGWSARDPRTGNSGVIFPRGISEQLAVIFQDGLIWGGIVQDGQTPDLRVGGQTYNIGTVEGRIIAPGQAESPNNPDVHIYRVRKGYATADLSLDAQELGLTVDEVRAQYAKDWAEWPWEKGAPWTGIDNVQDGGYLGPDGETVMGAGNGVLDRGEDANANGILDPGEDANGNGKLDGEFPGIAGADQVVWTVANDLSEGATFGLYGSPPVGLEMQLTAWGYQRQDALGNMIFKQLKVIYKGTANTPQDAVVDPMYICQWSDPDLGTYTDDFVGVDPGLSLAFVYNSSSVDGTYNGFGFPPPAAGYDFFQGVRILTGNPDDNCIFGLERQTGCLNLGMSSFGYFAAGASFSDPGPLGSYEGTIEWWNLLRGFLPQSDPNNPEPYVRADNGEPTFFPLSDDPAQGGDIDGVILPPGDRRMLMVTGPFTMALGDTQEVVISLIAALGSDRLSSVAVLKFFDRTAQATFDNLFQVVPAPPAPKVKATGLDQKVVLDWGWDPAAVQATESQDVAGFKFEGYNVYQLKSPSPDLSPDNAIKLATFDVVNEITTVLSEGFDPVSGVILDVPVQVGKNTGIERVFSVEEDRFRDRPLSNDQDYFFAVTAYNATTNLDVTTRALESSPVVIAVRPQKPAPGVRLAADFGQQLEVNHDGASDGNVSVVVIEPNELTGDNYTVTFKQLEDGTTAWDLTNASTGEVLLADQTDQSGALSLVVQGFQVAVSGPPLRGLDWSFEGPRWVTGTPGAGGDTFFEGAFLGPNFIASNLDPADFRSIKVEFFAKTGFTDTNGNGKYDIGEPYQLAAEDGQLANRYQGFGVGLHIGSTQVPFRVFDMETDPPRQLSVVIRDRDQNGFWDLHKRYDPGDPDFVAPGDFRFNYIFITDLDYDPTLADWDPNQGGRDYIAEALTDGGPTQWVLWLSQRGSREPMGAPFTMEFIAPNVNTVNDVFAFTTPAPVESAEQKKKDALELVNVFPNPYLGLNRLETSSTNRFVRFNHLPPNTKIRIFNLAGHLVRALNTNGTEQVDQYIDWDLQNWKKLPVASGIYLAHVQMPNVGTKVLKLIIVQEQQFLRTF